MNHLVSEKSGHQDDYISLKAQELESHYQNLVDAHLNNKNKDDHIEAIKDILADNPSNRAASRQEKLLVFKIIAADALYHEGLGNIVPKSGNAECAEHFAIITNAINLAKNLKIKPGNSKFGPFMDIDRSDIPSTTNLGPNGHELFVQSYNQAIKDHNAPINNVLINDQLNNQRVLNQVPVFEYSKTADQYWKTQTFSEEVNEKEVKISYKNYEKLFEIYNRLFKAFRKYSKNTNFIQPNGIKPPENISSESDLIQNYKVVADECKKLQDFLNKKSTVTVNTEPKMDEGGVEQILHQSMLERRKSINTNDTIDSDDTKKEDSDTEEENDEVSTPPYIPDVSPKSLKEQMENFTKNNDINNIDALKVKIKGLIENLEKEIPPLKDQLKELEKSKKNGHYKEKNSISKEIIKIEREIKNKYSDIEAYNKLISLPEKINSVIPGETSTTTLQSPLPFNEILLKKASNKELNTDTNTDTDTDDSEWD